MGMSQMCAGADHYFRSSKPHSRKLWVFSSELSHKLAELICHTEIFLKGKYIFREGEEVSVTTYNSFKSHTCSIV